MNVIVSDIKKIEKIRINQISTLKLAKYVNADQFLSFITDIICSDGFLPTAQLWLIFKL